MGKGIYFNGTTSTGVLDSTINLADGESFECDFLNNNTLYENSVNSFNLVLCSNSAGSDMIYLQYNNTAGSPANQVQFGVVIDSTLYPAVITTEVIPTEFLWNGNFHRIVITRNGTKFEFNVDGEDLGFITATASTFSIDYIAKDLLNTPDPVSPIYLEAFLGNIVIGSSTYPTTAGEGLILEDTSVAGNDITLTDPTWGAISEWEWVGDYVVVDKAYTTQGGTVREYRNQATRRRVICGIPFTNSFLSQHGEQSTGSIYAKNGDLETAVTRLPNIPDPDNPGGYLIELFTIDCDDEKFTPVMGTPFFHQTQLWASYTI